MPWGEGVLVVRSKRSVAGERHRRSDSDKCFDRKDARQKTEKSTDEIRIVWSSAEEKNIS